MTSLPDPKVDEHLEIGIAKQSSLRTEQGEATDNIISKKNNSEADIEVKALTLSTNTGTDQEAPKIPQDSQDSYLQEGPQSKQQQAQCTEMDDIASVSVVSSSVSLNDIQMLENKIQVLEK